LSLPLVLGFLGGYLIGSVPIGYILVQWRSRVDIRSAGSGNVGALNASVVTGSKGMGILVGVLDGVKGGVAVWVAWILGDAFWVAALALLGSVIGHNYPVWLGFKGGRGLATACGGLFLIGLAYTIVWCTLWAVLKATKQTILAANLLATLATPIVLFLLPAPSVAAVMTSQATLTEFRILAVCLSAVLYLRHHEGWQELAQPRPEEPTSGERSPSPDKERTL
jgi:glycerol-3-phosphate acyltransferase PlsY